MSECCESKLSSKKILLVIVSFVVALISYESFASGDHEDSSHGKMNHKKMDHSKMNHGKMEKTMNSGNRKLLDTQTKKGILSVLEENETLHNSFFEYNGNSVEKAAKSLKTKMKNISNPEISKLLKFSITKLDEIKSSSSREDNNQNYHLISMALIHIVNTYDVGKKYNAYSCPMVKKKWLQNSNKLTKIHNPYAKGMPHCGSKVTSH